MVRGVNGQVLKVLGGFQNYHIDCLYVISDFLQAWKNFFTLLLLKIKITILVGTKLKIFIH